MRAWVLVMVVALAGCADPGEIPDEAPGPAGAKEAPAPVPSGPPPSNPPVAPAAEQRTVQVNGTVVNQCHLRLVTPTGPNAGADTPCQPRVAIEGDEYGVDVKIPGGTAGALVEWRSEGAAAAVVQSSHQDNIAYDDYVDYHAAVLNADALAELAAFTVYIDHADMLADAPVEVRWAQETRADVWVTLFLDQMPDEPASYCHLC